MTKHNTCRALVTARKACRACRGLTNPSTCVGGVLDGDHIGPWSRWQGNLDAKLMIVGQDWGDTAYFVDHSGWDGPANATNNVLIDLLASIGITILPPSESDDGRGALFLTNAILCLKNGGMNAPVEAEWFANCGERFLKPVIELVRPVLVVSLGERAYRSIRDLYGLPRLAFRKAVAQPDPFTLGEGIFFVAVYHCGRRILNTHRPLEQQKIDWQRVGRALAGTLIQ